jgi:molybdopterin-guanine dinucleotide biosynthesis protein A
MSPVSKEGDMTGYFVRPPLNSVTVVILAGGKSSRFGSNKALACWNEKGSILDNIIDKVLPLCPDTALSVKIPEDYPEITLAKFSDIMKEKGPIGGLYSALFHSGTQWVMLLACDMPLVEPKILKYMLGIRTWAPVIVPYVRGRFEPLHALYHRSLFPLVENLLEKDRLKMRELLDLVPKYLVREKEIIRTAGSLKCLANINTLSEFRKLAPSVSA